MGGRRIGNGSRRHGLRRCDGRSRRGRIHPGRGDSRRAVRHLSSRAVRNLDRGVGGTDRLDHCAVALDVLSRPRPSHLRVLIRRESIRARIAAAALHETHPRKLNRAAPRPRLLLGFTEETEAQLARGVEHHRDTGGRPAARHVARDEARHQVVEHRRNREAASLATGGLAGEHRRRPENDAHGFGVGILMRSGPDEHRALELDPNDQNFAVSLSGNLPVSGRLIEFLRHDPLPEAALFPFIGTKGRPALALCNVAGTSGWHMACPIYWMTIIRTSLTKTCRALRPSAVGMPCILHTEPLRLLGPG